MRIIRALEVYLQTGRPISLFRSEHDFGGDYYRCLKIGITVERGELYRRIEERVERMMDDGLLEEVRMLLDRGFLPELKPMRAIGYKELVAFLAGRYSAGRSGPADQAGYPAVCKTSTDLVQTG